MKKYTPEKLMAESRYQCYFPTLPVEVQADVYVRMRELLEEERAYCDKGNYAHMAQILTSIALYEVLQAHGASDEEAFRAVSEEMWAFLDPSGMQRLARLPFFLPLMKRVVPLGFKKGSGTGWRYTWHWLGLHPCCASVAARNLALRHSSVLAMDCARRQAHLADGADWFVTLLPFGGFERAVEEGFVLGTH